MSKIGFVLSGGGTRCISHLGIIKALGEFGIHPSIISGTSAGAAIGAFLSLGYAPEKITDIIKNSKLFDFKNFLFGKAGLFNLKLYEKILLDHFPENTFESLPIPLSVTATDIIKCEPVYFSAGKLSTAIIASSCIPAVFEPIVFEERVLVDGGVINNFPIEAVFGKCDKIVGIYANSLSTLEKDFHMKDVLDRSLHIMLKQSIAIKVPQCDLFLEPPNMTNYSMFDFDKSEEIFNYGYEYALSQEKRIVDFMRETLPSD